MMENGGQSPDADASQAAEEHRLRLSACHGDVDEVKLLLSKRQVRVDAVDDKGRTALYIACENGFREIAELLLNSGASIDLAREGSYSRDEGREGYTALHVAVAMDKVDAVKLLLRRGADVHLRGDGSTPFHLSCARRHWVIADELLSHGADINSTTRSLYPLNGATALHLACVDGREETVEFLLSRNADINAVTRAGTTALQLSCAWERPKIAELLVINGAITSVFTDNSFSALHFAALFGMEETVNVLLNYEADVNAANGYFTPLKCACLGKFPNIAECLLKNGARVNGTFGTSEDGVKSQTPLHCAVEEMDITAHAERQIALVKLLLERGADINAENGKGTPFVKFLNRHSGSDGDQAVAAVFVGHLVKMQARSMFVNANNLSALTNHDMSGDFRLMCESEIQSMREKVVGDSSITFFDVFTNGPLRLADYMANESVEKFAESSDFESEFPIYANEIRKKFDQGRERRNLERQSDSVLNLSKFRYVPYVCMRRLNRYLTNDDLRKIIKAKPNAD